MYTFSRVAKLSVVVFAAALCYQPSVNAAEWKDPSKHLVRFVEVEPGVKLEVLDWGGSGDAVLLLAGHGDTGHIFDDFAPSLTSAFHVFALTRRGFGASAQPKERYDLSTMVKDIGRVVDALKIQRVHLVGHSIAGDEMTRFALTFPEKTGKLVYLDAAYDRVKAQQLEAKFPSLPQSSSGAAQESGSPENVRAFVARTEILMPESEIRATRVFGNDGNFLHMVTPDTIVSAVAKIVEHPDYASIRAPILAIYAVYQTPEQMVPRYKSDDLETRKALDQIFGMWQAFAKAERDDLRARLPAAHLIEINGANHYVFISHQGMVRKEIVAFLQTH